MRRGAWPIWTLILLLSALGCDDGADSTPDDADGAADSAVDPEPDLGLEPDSGADDPDAELAMGDPGELWRVDLAAGGLIISTQLEAWFDEGRTTFERATLRAVDAEDAVSAIIGEVSAIAIDGEGRFEMDFGTITLPGDFNPAGFAIDVVLQVHGRIVDDETWCGTIDGEVPLLMQSIDGSTFGAAPWPMETEPFCPGEGPDVMDTIGGDRPAGVLVPADYDAERAWPLVMVLHGYGASGQVQINYLRIAERVDADGVIVIAPDGTVDGDGQRHWQGRACCGTRTEVVDDLGYLVGLVDEAAETWNIDRERVFAVGHSNGGFMAHDLACLAGDTFRGIVSLAGSAGIEGAECPDRDVAVLNVHGDMDDTVLYGGAPWHVGAEASAARWVAQNGCGPAEEGEALDLDPSVDGPETAVTRWSGCSAPVEAWRMVGSGHVPPFDGRFAVEVIAWLQASVAPAEPPPADDMPDEAPPQ